MRSPSVTSEAPSKLITGNTVPTEGVKKSVAGNTIPQPASVSRKRKVSADADTPRTRKKANPSKSAPGTTVGDCGLTKKEFGDAIKSTLALNKYGLNRTVIPMRMDAVFFRAFFAPVEGVKITPAKFDDNTPVVVADLGHEQAAELFGVSKVIGGNRMEATHLVAMAVVLYPRERRAMAWTTV